MYRTVLALPLLMSLAAPGAAHAHSSSAPPPSATVDMATGAQAAVRVVDAFTSALGREDLAEVERLLAPDVVVLESGGAERSRSEYLGHHAKADAKFLASARVELKHRIARVDGALAWVASESEVHAMRAGKPMIVLSAESMVLRETPQGWRIVHIHWSSRPKKGG